MKKILKFNSQIILTLILSAGIGIIAGVFLSIAAISSASRLGNDLTIDEGATIAKNLTVGGSAGITIGMSIWGTAQTVPTNGLIVQGNVGIGTTDPKTKLDVVGAVKIRGSSYSYFIHPDFYLKSDSEVDSYDEWILASSFIPSSSYNGYCDGSTDGCYICMKNEIKGPCLDDDWISATRYRIVECNASATTTIIMSSGAKMVPGTKDSAPYSC